MTTEANLLALLRWCVRALGRGVLSQYPEGRRAMEVVEQEEVVHGAARGKERGNDCAIDCYAVCPHCGGDGEIEGTMDTVDPQRPDQPVVLRERFECPGCEMRWWEEWTYRGQAAVGPPARQV